MKSAKAPEKKSGEPVKKRKPVKKVAAPLVLDERQRYSMQESAAVLRQCLLQTFRDVKAGKLASFKVGKRRYVMGSELIQRSRPPETATSTGPSHEVTA